MVVVLKDVLMTSLK